jgi:hypothetical protein
MKRRELIALLGGAMTAASGLRAQQKTVPVIGYLNPTSPSANAPNVAAFRQGLSEAGYLEGQNWRSNTAGQRVATIDCLHWPPTSLAAKLM